MGETNYTREPLQPVEGIKTEEEKKETISRLTDENKDRIIYELWKIIDNIDTFGDMAKSDDSAFRQMVEKEQRKRWDILDEPDVDKLYKEFFGTSRPWNGKPRQL